MYACASGGGQSALAYLRCTTHPVALRRLLGTTENALGLRDWLEERGHTLVVTSDKEGDDSELDKNLPDTDILITTVWIVLNLIYQR